MLWHQIILFTFPKANDMPDKRASERSHTPLELRITIGLPYFAVVKRKSLFKLEKACYQLTVGEISWCWSQKLRWGQNRNYICARTALTAGQLKPNLSELLSGSGVKKFCK